MPQSRHRQPTVSAMEQISDEGQAAALKSHSRSISAQPQRIVLGLDKFVDPQSAGPNAIRDFDRIARMEEILRRRNAANKDHTSSVDKSPRNINTANVSDLKKTTDRAKGGRTKSCAPAMDFDVKGTRALTGKSGMDAKGEQMAPSISNSQAQSTIKTKEKKKLRHYSPLKSLEVDLSGAMAHKEIPTLAREQQKPTSSNKQLPKPQTTSIKTSNEQQRNLCKDKSLQVSFPDISKLKADKFSDRKAFKDQTSFADDTASEITGSTSDVDIINCVQVYKSDENEEYEVEGVMRVTVDDVGDAYEITMEDIKVQVTSIKDSSKKYIGVAKGDGPMAIEHVKDDVDEKYLPALARSPLPVMKSMNVSSAQPPRCPSYRTPAVREACLDDTNGQLKTVTSVTPAVYRMPRTYTGQTRSKPAVKPPVLNAVNYERPTGRFNRSLSALQGFKFVKSKHPLATSSENETPLDCTEAAQDEAAVKQPRVNAGRQTKYEYWNQRTSGGLNTEQKRAKPVVKQPPNSERPFGRFKRNLSAIPDFKFGKNKHPLAASAENEAAHDCTEAAPLGAVVKQPRVKALRQTRATERLNTEQMRAEPVVNQWANHEGPSGCFNRSSDGIAVLKLDKNKDTSAVPGGTPTHRRTTEDAEVKTVTKQSGVIVAGPTDYGSRNQRACGRPNTHKTQVESAVKQSDGNNADHQPTACCSGSLSVMPDFKLDKNKHILAASEENETAHGCTKAAQAGAVVKQPRMSAPRQINDGFWNEKIEGLLNSEQRAKPVIKQSANHEEINRAEITIENASEVEEEFERWHDIVLVVANICSGVVAESTNEEDRRMCFKILEMIRGLNLNMRPPEFDSDSDTSTD